MTSQLEALAATYGTPPTADEQADVDRCEALRARLLQVDDPVGDVFEARGASPDATTVAAETSSASCPPAKALLLYRVVRALRPAKVVEFGSALGVSGSYMASALRANGTGELVTVEGSASRAAVAAASIESTAPGVTRSVRALFDDALHELDGADLFFNDGNHARGAVLRYSLEAATRMAQPSVLLVDDVTGFSDDMQDAWKELTADRRFARSVEVGGVGMLALTGKRRWLR